MKGDRTYPSHITYHLRRQSPRSPSRGTFGAALRPDIEMLVAVAGVSVPVAAVVVVHNFVECQVRGCGFS